MSRSEASAARRELAASRLLIAADETGLDQVAVLLAALPSAARGRAFVEVETAADVRSLAAPGGMTVTWLVRENRLGLPGAALDRAVRAWLSEMVVDGMEGPDITAWVACDGSAASALLDGCSAALSASRVALLD